MKTQLGQKRTHPEPVAHTHSFTRLRLAAVTTPHAPDSATFKRGVCAVRGTGDNTHTRVSPPVKAQASGPETNGVLERLQTRGPADLRPAVGF